MSRLFFGSFFFILTSFSTYATEIDCSAKHCLAIIDAGSTGSRLHVYSFDFDKSNTPINIHEELIQKNSPGLASIRSDVTTVNAYMDELFKGLNLQNIPVYFYATAGMRLLSSPEQKIYYQNIKNWFAKHQEWTLLAAKTIPGNEEGLYGWLAINQQLGRLEQKQNYVSFMDMGGASVQIATPIINDYAVLDKENDVQRINVYNHDITLFVHSFLGLGQTEITHQSLDKKDCFADGYEMENNLFGKGNAINCEEHMEQIINNVHNVKDIVQPILVDAPKTEWYASGGVVYTATDAIFDFPTKFTSEAFLKKAEEAVCQQSWEKIAKENANTPFLYGYCLFAAYDYALMVKGYGLSPKQEINYLPTKSNSDWTLGVVLLQKK
jgi:Golgi nucleoside diphosphatase